MITKVLEYSSSLYPNKGLNSGICNEGLNSGICNEDREVNLVPIGLAETNR